MLTVPRWVQGDHVAVVWPGGVALIDASVGLVTAERIWSRLQRESKLGTFLKTLAEGSETGFLDLPAFAIAVMDGERCHIAVRGDVAVDAQVSGRVETISGEGITTWAEKVLLGPEALRLGHDGTASQASGPLADGVVIAGGLVVGEFSTTPSAADSAQAAPAPPQQDVLKEPVAEYVASPPVIAVQQAVPEPVFAPAPEINHVDPPGPNVPVAPETLVDEGTGAPEVVEENPYASLWGDHSIAMDVEAAAIREGEPDEPAPHVAAAPVVTTRKAQSTDQLEGDTVADDGEVDVVMGRVADGPHVLARFCDRGHANPPERAVCFVCGSTVAGDARRAARPQLGWLRIEGGETIPLHGPVIAGRNPKSTAIKLEETPRLVALPYPHVSGTHVAFIIEDWRIMARDLRSSNGTFLRRQGKPPVRLPETSVLLVPGDLIDLGKGLFIRLERTP